jgi:hypothetical protein
VALETARRSTVFSRLAVYEPGVSVDGSIRVDWMPRYRELLATGDRRGAFAWMVRESAGAPATVRRLPLSWVRLILRLAISHREWQAMEPLLEANLLEHAEVARLDAKTVGRYSAIASPVLLLGGQKSPSVLTTDLFGALECAIPDSRTEILDGLDHEAPGWKAPDAVAERVRRYLLTVLP